MSPLVITLIVIAVLIGILVALYFVGNKMQKKQMAQKEEMQAAAQQTSMLIIDKKMMKLKDAGLPKVVMEQTPKRFRNAKMPIVKAKVGPQTLNLICDDGIFDDLPTKCEVKAMVSGIYITEIKSVRGKKKAAEEPKKKSFGAKMRKKQRELQNEYAKEEKEKEARKAAKAQEKKKQEQAKKITK
ncbi:uncharacterized protein BN724_00605 [Clostridium sp. CAG:590]|jgi:hypothetical protein|nr:uncharacterized protein BN724_00605 [Clostridium sp. CAG:590]